MSASGRAADRRWIVVAVLAVVVVAVLLAYLLSRQESASDVVVVPTQMPTPTETPGPSVTPPPTETPSPTETPTEAPTTPPPTEEATEPQSAGPTDEDRQAFIDANAGGRAATGDIDGDGVDEVVVASVRNNAVRIAVGTWDGSRYRRTFTDDGGPAQRITKLHVADYNNTAGLEMVTEQRAGTEGRSLSIWGPAPPDLSIERQEAKGGCWDGFHTYGISGATIEPGRVTATCDGSPQPPEAWSSDVYEWRKGRWTYVRTQDAGA